VKDNLILPAVIAAATSLKLFAQEVSVSPGIGSLIGNVGVLGILVWYLWYNTSVSQPKALDKFSNEQAALRESSEREQAALRAAFASEQKELRAAFASEQASLRDSFAEELARMRAHTAQEAAELRAILAQAIGSMRLAVHDVKDTAHTAIVKTEAAVAKGLSVSDSQKIPVVRPPGT
jgi:hypothetical protein